jgi:hypothetical protein
MRPDKTRRIGGDYGYAIQEEASRPERKEKRKNGGIAIIEKDSTTETTEIEKRSNTED